MRLHARIAVILLSLTPRSAAWPQTPANAGPGATLLGRALYLRGCWMADELEFDGDGQLRGRSDVGPLTLSGVDVMSVQLQGHSLAIRGVRVALVPRADGAPGLERKRIHSVTNIVFSLRHGDKRKYVAEEEVQLVLHPDKGGSYENALRRVFLYGFGELAAAAPAYWQCYARTYWQAADAGDVNASPAHPFPTMQTASAETAVERCVGTSDDGTVRLGGGNDGHTSSPELLSPLDLPPLARAYDLQVQGEAVLHVYVRADGRPVGLQIVRALGGGVDEAMLQALSQARFQPAMRNGTAVPVSMDLHVNFGVSAQTPAP